MTTTRDSADLELRIRGLCDAGDKNGAVTLLLEGYGRELRSLLIWRLGDRQVAREAKTEARNGIARLREKLPVDDRTLLVLRVNRGLDWKEIAQVMASTGGALSASVLEKETVRLRKRYQLAKEKLRRMATAEGLIDPKRKR